MSSTSILILTSLPGAYFNAVLVCYFVSGLFPKPMAAMKSEWPFLRSVLAGFVPASFLSALIQWQLPTYNGFAIFVVCVGVVVSAVLLHRSLLTEAKQPRRWNTAIAVLACGMIVLLGLSLNSL